MKRKILTLALCLSLTVSNLPAVNVNASDSNPGTTSTSDSSEKKRYIVVFKDKPVSASIKKYAKKAKSLEKEAFKTQNVSVKKIEKITENKVRTQNTFLVNTCSIDATYEEAMKIKKLSTVADCYEAFAYTPTMEQAVDLCDINDVWNNETMPLSGKGTVVSIIDTGVKYDHSDLADSAPSMPEENLKLTQTKAREIIKDLGYGYYCNNKVPFAYNYAEKRLIISNDLNYHGTHVAGIAAGQKSKDFSGVAYDSQILAMQVFPGSGKSAFTDDIVQAIEDSVKLGADVINLSLGTVSGYTDYDSMEIKAVNAAYNSGCIIAAAAGNERNSTSNSINEYNNPYGLIDTGLIDNPGSLSNTITVAACEEEALKTGNVKMCEFSSWGPTPELEIKPEITAPGLNIRSLGTDSRFKTQNGTSMATPFITGVSALIKQSVNDKDLNLTGSSLSNFIKSSIINTASPLMDYTFRKGSVPYSVRQQGSGLVNAKNAVDNNVIATYNGDATIELRNIKEGTTTIPLEIQLTNYGKTDESYSLNDCQLYTEFYDPDEYACRYGKKGTIYLKKSTDSYVHFNNDTVTVKPGETTTISADVILSPDMKVNNYVEGFITINGNISLNLPLLGFYGDWDMLPIFDEPTGSENCIMDKYEYGPSIYLKDKDEHILGEFNKIFDINHSAISLNPDSKNNIAIPCLTRLRNAYTVKVSVVDSNDNLIQNIGTYSYLRKNRFSSQSAAKPVPISSNVYNLNDIAYWDGTRFDEKTQETVPVEDGQYYFIIKAKNTKNAPYQTVKIPILVDSEIPEIDATYEYDKSEKKMFIDVLAQDNFEFIPDITFTVNDFGKYIKKATFNYNTDGELLDNGYKRFTIEDVVLFTDYIDVKIQDYAKNINQKAICGHIGLIDETEENTQQNSNQTTKDTLGPVIDIIPSDNLTKTNYNHIFSYTYEYVAQRTSSDENVELTFKVYDPSGINERYKQHFRVTTRALISGVITTSSFDIEPEKIDDSTYKVVLTPEDLEKTWNDIDTPQSLFKAEFTLEDNYRNKTSILFHIYPPEDGPDNYIETNTTRIKTYLPNQCIVTKDMLNEDNTFTINLDVIGMDFEYATVNGIEAEKIYPENYEYTNYPSRVIKLKVDIPLTVGKNYYTVLLLHDKPSDVNQKIEPIYRQSFGTILYNGDNISYTIKSKSPLENDVYMCNGELFDFDLDVNSKLDALIVSINNSIVYSYNEVYTNYNEDNIITLPLSYNLKGTDINTLKIKVVDICGNETEQTIKVRDISTNGANNTDTNTGTNTNTNTNTNTDTNTNNNTDTNTNTNTDTNTSDNTNSKKKNIKDTEIKFAATQVYNGKKIILTVTIKDGNTKLQENVDYTITYKDNLKIGEAKVLIKGIGKYTGTVLKTFKIVPNRIKIKKILTNKKNTVSLKSVKLKYKVKYEFFYSTKKKGKYIKLGISNKPVLNTNKLKRNITYFIKARALKKIKNKTYAGNFSKVQKFKIK